MSVTIEGLPELQNLLNKIENPHIFFNKTVYNAAIKIQNNIILATPVNPLRPFKSTQQSWEKPIAIAASVYKVDNSKTTADQMPIIPPQNEIWNVAQLINDGRGEVRPKKPGVKALFIPKTTRAIRWYALRRKTGIMFPKNWVYGTDYFFTKRVRPVAGTHFIDKEETKGVKILEAELIKKLMEHFR